MSSHYPLLLEPILLEKVWGGRRLVRLGKNLPEGKQIGESWEVADLATTSASGAGGGAIRSVVRNGELAGKTLGEVIEAWGEQLLGASFPAQQPIAGRFPLLIKYLDARENLSVQVHPSRAFAAANPDAKLKTEAWFIVEAEPGSVIYTGLREGVGPGELREAARLGRLEEILVAIPAIAGECHTIPSGICHALGAGVLVAEVQTPSDTTFRVWDWGRSGRAMHLEEALACVEEGCARPPREYGQGSGVELACNEHFRIEAGTSELRPGRCAIVMMVQGQGRTGGRAGVLELATGQTAVIPAHIAEGARIEGDGRWLVITLEGQ